MALFSVVVMEYCGNQAIVLECERINFENLQKGAPVFPTSWLSGCCYLNKIDQFIIYIEFKPIKR